MNTYDYMYNVLKLRGTIEITIEQLMKLKKEGVPFLNGYFCHEKVGLVLKCGEAEKLEAKINDIICNSKDTEQVMYATDIWTWKYLEEEYVKDHRDNGIHFINLTIYYKGEEEDDN